MRHRWTSEGSDFSHRSSDAWPLRVGGGRRKTSESLLRGRSLEDIYVARAVQRRILRPYSIEIEWPFAGCERSPLRRHRRPRPLPRVLPLTSGARCHTCTAFRPRGSHHLDGLLRVRLGRFVAPCRRPWDSPGSSRRRATAVVGVASLPRCEALQSFPHPCSRVGVAADRGPLAVGGLRTRLDLEALLHTSVRCSYAELPPCSARCSPGLPGSRAVRCGQQADCQHLSCRRYGATPRCGLVTPNPPQTSCGPRASADGAQTALVGAAWRSCRRPASHGYGLPRVGGCVGTPGGAASPQRLRPRCGCLDRRGGVSSLTHGGTVDIHAAPRVSGSTSGRRQTCIVSSSRSARS